MKKQIIFEKQKLMEQKNKAKEELKKIKLELKNAKPQLSKKKSNQKPKLTPNDTEENIVIESNATQIFCQSILKYGFNKGNHCSFKIHQNGLCKRHYHLLEKKNI
jgi:hypothetical protein